MIGLNGIKSLTQTKWGNLTNIILGFYCVIKGGNHINDDGLYYIGVADWPNLKAINLSKLKLMSRSKLNII